MPRVCTTEGFAQELNERGGLDPTDLTPLSVVSVTTECTTYRLTLIDPLKGHVLVQEGSYFPIPFRATLCGSSFGGSMLKLRWIGIGMRLELHSDDGMVVTTSVLKIDIEEAPSNLQRVF